MIATSFYNGQGLGNQLWVYVGCRAISEKLQFDYSIIGQENFKGSDFLEIDFGVDVAPNISSNHELSETSFKSFHEGLFYDPDLDCFSSDFDENVLALKPFTKISGLFQSEDYLFGDLTLPKKYIKVKAAHLKKKHVPDDCCVINLRGGEYKRHKNLILPNSYWHNAMRNMNDLFGIDKFMVVTDDLRYSKAMFPELPVLKGGIAECYTALYQAKYLILSNSSFSYFPVKTGINKSFVIAPMHWARFGNKHSRWASVANFYKDWTWQDADGVLHSYADCLGEVKNTREYYKNHFCLSTVPSAVMKTGIRGYFPTSLKRYAKKILSLFFPKHIG